MNRRGDDVMVVVDEVHGRALICGDCVFGHPDGEREKRWHPGRRSAPRGISSPAAWVNAIWMSIWRTFRTQAFLTFDLWADMGIGNFRLLHKF